jgi:malate-CoA ligase subunit alpha
MAIFINENTRIIVQGFTGKIGSFHAEDMIKYGS